MRILSINSGSSKKRKKSAERGKKKREKGSKMEVMKTMNMGMNMGVRTGTTQKDGKRINLNT